MEEIIPEKSGLDLADYAHGVRRMPDSPGEVRVRVGDAVQPKRP